MIKCRVTIKQQGIDQLLEGIDQANYQDLDLFQRIKIHQNMMDKAYKDFENNFFIFVNFVVKSGGLIDIDKENNDLEYLFFPSQFIIKIPEDLFHKIKNHSLVERVEVV